MSISVDGIMKISFFKEESFQLSLKSREGVSRIHLDRELVPHQGNLVSKGLATHSTFIDTGIHK